MTIELSADQYQTLIFTLGYAAGNYIKDGKEIPEQLKAVTDEIIVQGGGKPYWRPATEQ